MDYIIGTVHWSGEYRGAPAIIVTYYGGGALWRWSEAEKRFVRERRFNDSAYLEFVRGITDQKQ